MIFPESTFTQLRILCLTVMRTPVLCGQINDSVTPKGISCLRPSAPSLPLKLWGLLGGIKLRQSDQSGSWSFWKFGRKEKVLLVGVYTVMLIEMPRFSVAKLLLHHYKSDLAHISDLYSLVIGLYKSGIWAKNN